MIRRVFGATWLSSLLLLAACGGGGGGGGPSTVSVPSVTGLAQANAVAAITAAGLTSGAVTTQVSSTVAAGSVISQNPAAGTSAATGSSVALVVSLGPPVNAPNVVGQTQAAATTAITAAGLAVGSVTSASSASVPAGSVISQNPPAGSSVAPGSAIALVISSGPPVAVPNVVGLTQAAATSAITGAGLVVGSVSMQSSGTVAAGSVISQNPAANSSVAPGSVVNLVVSTGAAPANTLSVIIDAGPASIPASQRVANVPYATVTLCTPGSTTACQTIDHVEVDTGSVGLQILAETLNGSAVPRPIIDPASNSPLRECVQFADGYSWGSMVVVDVTIGQRRIGSLPVHIIGDTATSGQAPTSCVQGPPENTVAQFGANGILGVGYWLQDCGTFCKTNAPSGLYYVCPNGTCTPTTVDLPDQAQNPIAQFTSDANGVVIDLPRVAAPGAATVQGTMYFGIGTQANNGIGSATLYTVDGNGELSTVFNGLNYNKSFIDSGSNGFFFSSSLTQCTQSTGFYCPTNSVQESATLTGRNGNAATISFTVDNADSLIAVTPSLFAFPNLAGSNAGATGLSSSFDWGLPFFFGRKVYVLFENGTINGTSGPASAF